MQSIPSTSVGPSASSPATTRAIARRWSPQLETARAAERRPARAGGPEPGSRPAAPRSTTPIFAELGARATRIRSDSFTRSSAASAHDGRALGARRRHRQDRHLVDGARHDRAAHLGPAKRPGPTRRSAIGSPSPVSRRHLDPRAHRLEHVEHARPRRVHTHAAHGHRAVPESAPATRKNAADEMSPGTRQSRPVSRRPGNHRDRLAVHADVAAERGQHPLRVVAAPCGLDHA